MKVRHLRHALLIGATLLAPISAHASDSKTTAMTASAAAQLTAPILSVRTVGEGPDMVLVPGLASDGDVWDATVEALSGEYRLHVASLAGMGETPPAARNGAVLPAARDALLDYLKREGLQDATLVGHSMGGLVSLMAAEADPSRIARVVSVDSLPFYALLFDPSATRQAASRQGRAMADQLMAAPKARYDAMQAQGAAIYAKSDVARARIAADAKSSDRRTVTDALAELMATDFRDQLPNVAVPVHIIYAHDPAMPLSREWVTARFEGDYAGLPDARYTRIDESYHFIMDDQPEAFQAALLQALTGGAK